MTVRSSAGRRGTVVSSYRIASSSSAAMSTAGRNAVHARTAARSRYANNAIGYTSQNAFADQSRVGTDPAAQACAPRYTAVPAARRAYTAHVGPGNAASALTSTSTQLGAYGRVGPPVRDPGSVAASVATVPSTGATTGKSYLRHSAITASQIGLSKPLGHVVQTGLARAVQATTSTRVSCSARSAPR